MKNLKLILSAVLFSGTSFLHAQQLPWPTDPNGIDYRVDSSYGPRNVNSGTFVHKGLDFNAQTGEDLNNPIVAAANGTIFGNGRSNTGLYWIGIDYGNGRTFAYLHIFPSKTISKGNFRVQLANAIAKNNEIRSYRRLIVENDGIEDVNLGTILFYSENDNKGHIVKVLGINGIHPSRIKVSASDSQDILVSTVSYPANTVVVSSGTDGVLETMPYLDDVYSEDKNSILVGPNGQPDTTAGYVTVSTIVVAGEIIAPLGSSGVGNSHLHLQVSHADVTLANDPSLPDYNDGQDNVIQYLVHSSSTFSGGIVAPVADAVLYHTENHDSERVTAAIRQRPAGANYQTYHGYELDRVKLFAIPPGVVTNLAELRSVTSGNTFLINGSRSPAPPVLEPPCPGDPFRAEFDYGGSVAAYDNAFPPFISNTGLKSKSVDAKTTGLWPEGGLYDNPVTGFVFNQWNTRIKADYSGLALRSEDAAYPDGWYGLVATAESVDRDEAERFVSTPTVIKVDNFRPYVERVTAIKSGGETVYDRGWALSADDLKLIPDMPGTDGYLENGESCDILATFSEYMGSASLSDFPPQTGDNYAIHKTTLATTISVSGHTADVLELLTLTGADTGGRPLLKVESGRKSIELSEITRNADGIMGGADGSDTFHYLRIEAGPPVVQYGYENFGYSHTCVGSCGSQAEPIYFNLNTVRFGYSDVGSGIAGIKIYKDAIGTNLVREIPYGPHVYTQDIELPLDDGLYAQVVTDNTGKSTTMWFRVDPVSPRSELVGINLSPDFSTFTVYGVLQDTGSGLAFFHLTKGAELIKDFAVTPGDTDAMEFDSPALAVFSGDYYVFSARDRAENTTPPQRVQFARVPSAGYAEIGPEQANVVANYISKVSARGDPCTINITSQLNPFEIPVSYTLPNGGAFSASLSVAAAELTELSVTPQPLYGRITVNVSTKNCSVIDGGSVCADACTVALEGYSIYPLANGPKLAVTRSSSPTDGGIMFRFGWSEITFYDLVAPPAANLTMEDVSSPAAPYNYVVFPPGENRSLRVKFDGATYSGIKIKTCGLPGNAAAMKMIHYGDDGSSENITQPSEGDCITGLSGTNSLFSVVAPISLYDQSGPVVVLNSKYSYREPGSLYISSFSVVELETQDMSSNMFALAGVASTYYMLDVDPTPECLSTAYNPGAPRGTCENPLYNEPFLLSEGLHTLYHVAVDKIGNMGTPELVQLRVDGTPPTTVLQISGDEISAGVTVYATVNDTITLSAFDPQSNGVASGLTTTYFLVDISTEECSYSDEIGGINGMGSCVNHFYTGPFTLPVGEHVIYFFGEDNVGNLAPVKTAFFNISTAQPALPIVPSSGSIGVPFTIEGAGFGVYSAGTTMVLLGGATAPLTLWTDTKIQGTIPGALAAGQYPVVVKRGAEVLAEVSPFTVTQPALYSLTPSSGPIGLPFTITGESFGNYVAGYTRVLLGGATAPLTLWTDTKIQGTVPGILSPGEQSVVVERLVNGGSVSTSSAAFTVLGLSVYGVLPASGAIGVPFTVTGTGFGNYVAGSTGVRIGGLLCPLSLWTDTKIQGTVPGGLAPGDYRLIVGRVIGDGRSVSQPVMFRVVPMEAYWLAPSSGPIGMPFTITGTGFGNYTLPYTSVLIGGTTAPLTLWTDTKIQGTVPGGLASGQHPVLVERRTSDGGLMQTSPMTFEVVNVDVASMTPVAGPIGLPFTIYGAGFGNYSAGYTKVLLGGTTCPLTLWTDTQIKGTIPGSLAPGEYPVVVERTLNGGQAQSAPLLFTVAAPEAYSLSPSSGPIGLPFIITGGNFGNYVANYTKVLIGGATAPLTLWTDTQIKGTIPGSLADGDHELVVERALNGGVVRTSTFTFTVGTPYLDTVSPSTASVVAPFTITGYNFGNYVANYTKVLIGGATTALTLWTDTKIQGKLPFLLAGTYPVQVQRYLNGALAESATAYIAVEEPVISSMTPVSGAVGTVFNLYGTGFGPYESAIAKVFIGGAQCALSLWTDTRITGTVPTALSYGTHTVVAARGQALANPLEFYIPGGYTPSMMRLGTTPSALEFKLGEVYVYPDPAKGGKVPTFHIEVGTADSVKLKIYTVAGQLAHEATLTGSPQAAGAVYAYEYAWTGRIASGVYYYTMEAEKGGKKLKTRGKFAVIR